MVTQAISKKIITEVKETKVPVMCCGEKMQELVPGVTDAATEKQSPLASSNPSI